MLELMRSMNIDFQSVQRLRKYSKRLTQTINLSYNGVKSGKLTLREI